MELQDVAGRIMAPKDVHVLIPRICEYVPLHSKRDVIHLRVVFFFFLLAILCSLQDLSSLTRDRTWAMAVKAPSPNHWTTREFPPVKDLKMGDSPGLSVWAHCNHRCPYEEEAEGQRRYDSKRRGQSDGIAGRGL